MALIRKKYYKSIKILFTVFLMLFVFTNVYSQNNVLDSLISIKVKGKPLGEVLQEIEEDVNYNFSYNPDLISTQKQIKKDYKDISLQEILDDLIHDSTLTYVEIDKQIVIYKRNKIQSLQSVQIKNHLDSIITINGHVMDAVTGENLPYANLAIVGKSFGTITNESGKFKLKVPLSCINENVVISYVGYKNTIIQIEELSVFNNAIYLEKDILKIQEAVIRVQNPLQLLKQAIDNFDINYYHDPYQITGFYRESVHKKTELMSISEAVINIYKSPYGGLYSDQIKLLKSRKNIFYNTEDTLAFKLKGGLHTSLYLDFIKNPQFFMRKEYLEYFHYKMDNIVMYDGNAAYVIKFKPKYYLEENYLEGSIYLNSKDLSILAINTNLTEDALDEIGSNLVVKSVRKTKVSPEKVQYKIAYRKIGSKYFLNQVKGELEFKVKHKKKLFATNYHTVFELAANYIDTIDVERFDRRDIIRTQGIFTDENHQYDSKFWGEYNYLVPNESLEDALVRIQKRLEAIKEEEN